MVVWPCPAQFITYWDVIFRHGVDHAPTNEKLAFFFTFLLERYDRYNDPKKHKSGHNLSEKKKRKKRRALRLFAYAVQIRG